MNREKGRGFRQCVLNSVERCCLFPNRVDSGIWVSSSSFEMNEEKGKLSLNEKENFHINLGTYNIIIGPDFILHDNIKTIVINYKTLIGQFRLQVGILKY